MVTCRPNQLAMPTSLYVLRNRVTAAVSQHKDLHRALDAVGREIGTHETWVIFELEAPRLRNPRRVAEGHGQVWRPAGASAQELLDVCGAAEVCEAAVLEGAS